MRQLGAALAFACAFVASAAAQTSSGPPTQPAQTQPAQSQSAQTQPAQSQPALSPTQAASPQTAPAAAVPATPRVEQPTSPAQQPPLSTGTTSPSPPVAPNAPLDAPGGAVNPGMGGGPVAPSPQPGDISADRTRTPTQGDTSKAAFTSGLREPDFTTGTVNNFFGSEGQRGVLIQGPAEYLWSGFGTAGEAWRQARNSRILPYGGALLLITLVALALFYFAKGTIKVHEPPNGRLIERFTYFERASHWLNAIAFCILAISGIVIAFGRYIILPWASHEFFGSMTYAMKNLHNFVGPVFAVTLAVMFFAYLRDNWPRKHDLKWLAKGGGLLTGRHVPSDRFNAGEKIVFWGGVLLLGSIVTVSGFVLIKIVPGMVYTRETMQMATMVHAIATILMMAMITAHIYLGTIGMAGAYRAMRDGYVDESWAKEHHELWWRDIKDGKLPARRTPTAEPPKGPVPQH
jgi:formate dehydrogenase subunit gamma